MRLPGASHQRSTGRHRHLALRNCSTHRTAGESRATHRVQPPIEASWPDRRLPASGSTSRRGGRCLLRPSLRNTGILPRFRPPDGCHIVRGPGRCKTPTSPTQGPHTHRVGNRRPVLSPQVGAPPRRPDPGTTTIAKLDGARMHFPDYRADEFVPLLQQHWAQNGW